MATKPTSTPDTAASTDTADKEFVVAPGRTVTADKDYGPGDTITLDADEGARLQGLGFLRQDDGSLTGAEGGPPVIAGAEIKEG